MQVKYKCMFIVNISHYVLNVNVHTFVIKILTISKRIRMPLTNKNQTNKMVPLKDGDIIVYNATFVALINTKLKMTKVW